MPKREGKQKRVAIIRTSDRATFRRCRRLWNWRSSLRGNRATTESALPLWIGTGVHFCLEDYHGHHLFETPADAFRAYASACRRTRRFEMPTDWREGTELAVGMMDHYLVWLRNRDPLKTYVHNNEPQVETTIYVPIPFPNQWYDEVYYQLTLDRVIEDRHGFLRIVEYKTAKQYQDFHLDTDQQVTSYCWGASAYYDKPVVGVVYQQHLKALPNEARILKSGLISTDKNQRTTHSLYRDSLLDLYGKIEKAPAQNVEFLNQLASEETEDRDKFIRRDFISRNEYQIQAEGQKILLELPEMLNPDTPLYPNPTRDCGWCGFQLPCVSFDDGSDWEQDLEETTRFREDEDLRWRNNLELPPSQAAV